MVSRFWFSGDLAAAGVEGWVVQHEFPARMMYGRLETKRQLLSYHPRLWAVSEKTIPQPGLHALPLWVAFSLLLAGSLTEVSEWCAEI